MACTCHIMVTKTDFLSLIFAQVPRKTLQACKLKLPPYTYCVFEATCTLKVYEDVGRWRPRGVVVSQDVAPTQASQASGTSSAVPAYIPQVIPHNFPLPSPRNCRGDVAGNWDFFKQQWNDYEIATGLDKRDESIRLATLRSAMGRDCLQIFLNLKLSVEDRKKVDKCLEALELYFKPTRNVVYKRYVFNTCVQQSDEAVQSYLTRLRKLAASCEYGERMDDFVRDRLVISLKDNGDKVRLLSEKKLDLQKAVQMCMSSKVASQQMKKIQGVESKQTEEVKKLGEKKKTARKPRPKKEAEKTGEIW